MRFFAFYGFPVAFRDKSYKTWIILLVLRILKWCVTFLWLQNQRSYVVKKSFEAVAFLMAIYLSTMTFRLQTLSIRSNIILALRCLRLSDYKLCQLCRSSCQHWGVLDIQISRWRCWRHCQCYWVFCQYWIFTIFNFKDWEILKIEQF